MPKKITHEYLRSQGLPITFPKRFWSKVKKTKHCWVFTGSTLLSGYGQMARGPKGSGSILAHRASWILNRGPIPDGCDVLHDCQPLSDNKACVRPNHLWLGNDSENFKDAFRKGDKTPMRGESNACHVLTSKDVIEIRRRYVFRGGVNSGKSLAREFDVTPTTITHIVLNQHWRHINNG